MATFTTNTEEDLRGLQGQALEFLTFIHEDMTAAIALLERTVRASDRDAVDELRRLKGAHDVRAGVIAAARE